MTSPLVNLISCGIIEKDSNGDVLWVWSYPNVTEDQKIYVTRKWNSRNEQKSVQSFVGARHNDIWIYIHSSEAIAANKLPGVKRVALALFAKDFNPRDYQELCKILGNAYSETGDPTQVLNHYLFAFSEGVCTYRDSKGSATTRRFNAECPMNSNHAKRLIRTFELETILIYTSLLLKKRIVVYHHSLEELFGWIETFPTLMKRRKVTDNLFPWVDLVPDELAELKNYSHYIAGCRDSSVSSKPELYDLLVNIPAREITVAPHAKESLAMTKAHKEIALFMVQLCESDDEQSRIPIIDEIAEKTQDLVDQLKALASGGDSPSGKKTLSVECIKERELPPAVENFLINLGVAENIFVI